jgi:putative flavoprotein involved in K+ transport
LQGIGDGKAFFASDLAENLAWSDEQARALLRAIDDLIAQQGLEAPAEDWPRDLTAPEERVQEPPEEMDLAQAGISTVIWATGYRPNLGWVGLPMLDEEGYPVQRRGVTVVPGLYILGLDWLHTAKSGLFPGIGEDAAYVAEHMAAHAVEH